MVVDGRVRLLAMLVPEEVTVAVGAIRTEEGPLLWRAIKARTAFVLGCV